MIARRFALRLLAAALMLVGPSKSGMTNFEYDPPDGFVPDAETAEKMAEILLIRMFGETNTEREMPLRATLKDGVWIVKGTEYPIRLGGVAEMHISKRDARILYFKHEA
jgi:hypothetical protein